MKDVDRGGPGRGDSPAVGTSLACSGSMSKAMMQKEPGEVVGGQVVTFQAMAVSHRKNVKHSNNNLIYIFKI